MTKYYCHLANYFASQPHFFDRNLQKKPNIRKCMELPFQQTKAEMWDEVTNTLCDLDFIQAKACAKMTYYLVKDFNDVLEVIPDNAENIRQEKARQARMDKYTRDLIAYAKGEITELDIPDTVPLRSEEEINVEIERIKTNPTRLDRLRDFMNFLGHEAVNLQNYAWEFPHFVVQQAWNWADSGSVGLTAEKGTPEIYESLILCSVSTRPAWNPIPQAILNLNAHSCVNAVAITPDGKKAISGYGDICSDSDDYFCLVWDLITGQMIQNLQGHTSRVHAVAITPNGKIAISGSVDCNCIIWDLSTGQAIHILKGHTSSVNAVAITPDGKKAISGSTDNTCVTWNLDTGKPLNKLSGHTSDVRAVAITPDGKRAVSGSEDQTCIVWDLITGKAIYTLKEKESACVTAPYSIYAVSITPDGKKAISGSTDHCCRVWDINTGQLILNLRKHTGHVFAVAITPDGRRAISSSRDRACIMWDLNTGQEIFTLKGFTCDVTAIAITPDAKRAISGSADRSCILWNLDTFLKTNTQKGHTDWVEAIAVTPNRKIAISTARDYTGIIWDIKSGQPINTLKEHFSWVTSISITHDSQRAISFDRNNLIIWDITSGEALYKVKSAGSTLENCITSDGKRAFCYYNKWCYIIDMNTGETIKILEGHTMDVQTVVVISDGRRAISGSGITTANNCESPCIVWDLNTGKSTTIFHGHLGYVKTIVITPDGKRAVSGSNDNTCILWDINTGKAIRIYKGHTGIILSLAISPDGKKLISASGDHTCIIWDLFTGHVINTLKRHSQAIFKAYITLDGSNAITTSYDNTCIIWDLRTGEQLGVFVAASEISSISYFPGGVILGEHSGKISLLTKSPEILYPTRTIITIQRIWDYEFHQYIQPSADCLICGHRFAPPASVLATIKNITKKAGLRHDQSPCLELPDEAWEDPGLLGNCPKCGAALKFNPFIAGGDY